MRRISETYVILIVRGGTNQPISSSPMKYRKVGRQMAETMSWLHRLENAQVSAVPRDIDLWHLPLSRVSGKVDFDGLERVSSQTLMDLLEVPQRHRRAGAYRRLARVMTELGWRATRVRDLNGRGFREQL